jgi:hypothetical protein
MVEWGEMEWRFRYVWRYHVNFGLMGKKEVIMADKRSQPCSEEVHTFPDRGIRSNWGTGS